MSSSGGTNHGTFCIIPATTAAQVPDDIAVTRDRLSGTLSNRCLYSCCRASTGLTLFTSSKWMYDIQAEILFSYPRKQFGSLTT